MSLYSAASDAIDIALKTDADYVDIRADNEYENIMNSRNKLICGVSSRLQESIGIRALFKHCWGFASTSSLDRSSIKGTVQRALNAAKKQAKNYPKETLELAAATSRKTKVADSSKKHPQFIEPEERLALIDFVNSNAYSSVKDLRVFDIKLVENHVQKLFFNSEGSEIEQTLIRSSLFFGAAVQGIASSQRVRTTAFGGVGGIEQFEEKNFDNFIDSFLTSLPEVAKARVLKPRVAPVVLNEEMGWNLCHEFCHAIESDLILMGQSPLGTKIGSKVGTEKVTIVDDASFKGYGEYYFDDEGVKASGTLIVEDGILFDFLQSRETAGKMSVIPTSNGRAQSCLYPPQVRQSNTFFEPGDLSFEELLETTREGVLVCDSYGGNADTVHGNFQLDAQFGRKIVRGELSDYVVGFSLIGNLYGILGDITAFSKEIGSYPAYCGKNGQLVSVGAISPKVALENVPLISTVGHRQMRRSEFLKELER